MSGTETVDPDELRALAKKLNTQLTPLFEKALESFEGAEIGGPAFSMYGAELALTYPSVQHFAMRDLQSKAQAVQSIIERLNATASSWSGAESASTIAGG